MSHNPSLKPNFPLSPSPSLIMTLSFHHTVCSLPYHPCTFFSQSFILHSLHMTKPLQCTPLNPSSYPLLLRAVVPVDCHWSILPSRDSMWTLKQAYTHLELLLTYSTFFFFYFCSMFHSHTLDEELQ